MRLNQALCGNKESSTVERNTDDFVELTFKQSIHLMSLASAQYDIKCARAMLVAEAQRRRKFLALQGLARLGAD
jgi:hypothetical protein